MKLTKMLTMSFIQITYDNIFDLITKFNKINFHNQIVNETYNFVIISENLYMGSYGGIFSSEMLNVFNSRDIPFIYDLLTPNLILVWWEGFCDNRGDLSLCRDGFVLVTKDMFRKMKRKVSFKKIKSSYF